MAALLLALLALLIWPATAAAQTDPDELARRHFESGAAYFEQAEYDAALREFKKAYELSQRPQILRNVSVVEERLGNLDKAIQALDSYLAAAPADPDVETVRIRRYNLRRRWDKREQERVERERAAVLEAQQARARARPPLPRPGQDATSERAAPPVRTPERTAEREHTLTGLLLLGVGATSGVAAIVTGALAKSEYDRLNEECKSIPCTDTLIEPGQRLALTSTVLTGVSVLGLAVGTLVLLTDSPDDGAPENARVQPEDTAGWIPSMTMALGPQGGNAEVRWRY